MHIFVYNKETNKEEEIICTPSHRIYIVNKGWIEAKKILANDKVLLYTDNIGLISKIYKEELTEEQTTYNFEVEDNHNYYVSEEFVLVHNKCDTNQLTYNGEPLYRGGDDFTAQLKDVRLTKEGLVKTSHGVSLNSSLDELSRFSKITQVDSIPDCLQIIKRGSKPHHFEIVPKEVMSFADYNAALKQIVFHVVVGG